LSQSFTERRERFRALLSESRCIRPASVFDPMSARCAEDLGFEMMMMAGSTASLAVLGAPDLVVMTLTEFADQARRVTRASRLPLLVDADHGYGNAINAGRTVEELEHAGVAALTLEDTALPIPYGSPDKPSLISVEEGAAKIRAAVNAKGDPSLIVAARTGAPGITGIDDTLVRVRAYEAANADAMFLTGITSREELDAIASATTLPLIIGYVHASIDDTDYLAARNVRIALQGHKPMMAGISAVYSAMHQLRDGVHPTKLETGMTDDLLARLTHDADFKSRKKDYLTST
jgi:oxaloacetate decarboxylase